MLLTGLNTGVNQFRQENQGDKIREKFDEVNTLFREGLTWYLYKAIFYRKEYF